MEIITLTIYFILTISWLYILIFSIKELRKSKSDAKSLLTILFTILLIDALRTLIETLYFGTKLSGEYEILPKEIFYIFSMPSFLIIPKIINVIATLTIIVIILRKWYPKKNQFEQSLSMKLEKEIELNKTLDELIIEKNKQLEELTKNLENRVNLEVEKNKIQEQTLVNQSKMAAMGEMIRNIAHQWRQPLSTITTISSGTKLSLEMDMLKKELLFENLDKITQTGQYLSQTIEDFQNFFKPSQNSENFECNTILEKALSILNPSLKANEIKIAININSKSELFGPYNEYMQVIINIINNAKDALLENEKENRFIKIYLESEDQYCVVRILDNGGGIDENILDRIFEPYFTTKHKSQGTGIGLYMAKEIIEKHMIGTINVKNIKIEDDNKVYKGTEFEIKIPTLNN